MNAKKIIAGLTIGLMSLALMGCELVSVNTDRDNAQVVLKVGDKEFTKEYVNGLVNTQLSYYGVDPADSTMADQIQEFRESMLESLAKTEIMRQEAVAQGYVDKLTDEERKAADEEYEKQKTYYESGFAEELQEEYADDVDKDAKIEKKRQEALADFLKYNHINVIEEYQEIARQDKALEKYQQEIKNRAQVTEEDVKSEYDKLLSEQKVSYDNSAAAYINASSGDTVQVYVPEGVRRVKHILIVVPDETKTALQQLQQQITTYTTQGDTAKVEEVQKQYDEKLAAALNEIKPKAEQALSRAKSGENFDKLIEELGQDPGAKTNPDGYAVHQTSTGTYEENFQNAAAALSQVGDISGLVDTINGYHILQYASNVQAGEVGLDAVRDKLQESMKTTKQDKALEERGNSLLDQYKSEHKVELYPERLKVVVIPGKENK